MAIETLGEALSLGWRVTMRCVHSREDGVHRTSSRECTYRGELDMQTLVSTPGRAFPLSRLESRLRCRGQNVVVMFQPPSNAAAAGTR
jgi:hypothetical protein